jgi:hypothetical protein
VHAASPPPPDKPEEGAVAKVSFEEGAVAKVSFADTNNDTDTNNKSATEKDEGFHLPVAFSGAQLPQVRAMLARVVPSTAEQLRRRLELAPRMEEEAWTNSNSLLQMSNIYHQTLSRETANVLTEDYVGGKASMRKPEMSRDKAMLNRHKRGRITVIDSRRGSDQKAAEAAASARPRRRSSVL